MTASDLKEQIPVIEVLKRYGINVDSKGFCRCIAHTERTASMKVYSKSWHCFGCGAHGDIFDIVRIMDGVDFKDAFKILGGSYERPRKGNLLKFRLQRISREKESKRLDDTYKQLCKCAALVCSINSTITDLTPMTTAWAELQKRYTNAMLHYEYLMDEWIGLKGEGKTMR